MSEELTDKIKNFFNSIECKPLYILETPRAGEEVDNGYGIMLPISRYAVLCAGEIFKDDRQLRLFRFEKEEKTTIHAFEKRGCINIYDFINELKEKDAYEVIYSAKEEEEQLRELDKRGYHF